MLTEYLYKLKLHSTVITGAALIYEYFIYISCTINTHINIRNCAKCKQDFGHLSTFCTISDHSGIDNYMQ